MDFAARTCIEAWNRLGTCRYIGMDIGAIPYTAILAWCDQNGFDHEATEIMIHVICTVDNERMSARAAAREVDAATGGR